MGGSDPAGLTLQALSAVDRLEDDFTATVVLGRGFVHEDALANWLASSSREYDIRGDVTDMADLMTQADMAIASFGVTAYELAPMAVPAVYLCLTEDHAESASALAAAGAAVTLGVHHRVDEATLSEHVAALLRDADRRADMATRASQLVDGRGAARVAALIVDRIANRCDKRQTAASARAESTEPTPGEGVTSDELRVAGGKWRATSRR